MNLKEKIAQAKNKIEEHTAVIRQVEQGLSNLYDENIRLKGYLDALTELEGDEQDGEN